MLVLPSPIEIVVCRWRAARLVNLRQLPGLPFLDIAIRKLLSCLICPELWPPSIIASAGPFGLTNSPERLSQPVELDFVVKTLEDKE